MAGERKDLKLKQLADFTLAELNAALSNATLKEEDTGSEVKTKYDSVVPVVTSAEITAGTSTADRRWNVAKIIEAAEIAKRNKTYTALTLAATIAWDVANLLEGKAKITIPASWAGTDIAFSLSNAANGFTGILSIYNDDSVIHNLTLPTAGIYAVTDGDTATVELGATSITELNFAHDGTKIKVTKGKFVTI